jgi:hypothetical protein
MMMKLNEKLTLDRPAPYEIKIPGELDQSWSEWDGQITLKIENMLAGPPVSTLSGTFDQAALQSLLRRLYAMGLPLISVICTEYENLLDKNNSKE